MRFLHFMRSCAWCDACCSVMSPIYWPLFQDNLGKLVPERQDRCGTHTHHFTALWILSETTRVTQYQKKHSPTHTHRGHQISLSASFIYYDPWHPPYSVHALYSLFPWYPSFLWSTSWPGTLHCLKWHMHWTCAIVQHLFYCHLCACLEQYEAFLKFNYDEISRRFGETAASCKFVITLHAYVIIALQSTISCTVIWKHF